MLRIMKKLTACVLCAGMALASTTALATADGKFYLNDSFGPAIDEVLANGWIAMGAGVEATVDGTVQCLGNGSTSSNGIKYNVALPTQYVATFRMKANALTGNGRFQPIIYANGTRVFLQIYSSKINLRGSDNAFQSVSKSTEIGAWYTYTCAVNNGVATVSRQKDGDSQAEILFQDFALQSQSGSYLTMAVEGHADSDVEFDDLKIWTGMSVGSAVFTKDGSVIDSFEGDGVLKASADIYYCDNDGEGDIDTTLMMIVFDRYGKIVDLGISRGEVAENSVANVEVSVDLTGINCAGGFAEVY